MQASRRYLSSVVTVVVIAALAGCSAGPTAEAARSAEPAETTTSPPADPTQEVPAPPDQLTFEAGADLDPQVWRAGWHVEPIDLTHGYTVVYPRDDWEEKHLSGDGCEGSRYHRFGSLDGLDLELDDRTLSDQFLAQILEMPVEEISEGGSDVLFPVVGRSPMTVDFRVRAGSFSDGGSWLAAARVFGALDTALVIQLDCDPGPMTGASGQQMFDLLPEVVGLESLDVGIGRVDWNVVEALDFEDGDDLVASSAARWVDDALTEDASWTLDEPDLDGAWSYVSADGDCTAAYEQSRLDAGWYGASAGDREASDGLLAASLEYELELVQSSAVDGTFALAVPGNDLVAMRFIEVGDWVMAARSFKGPLLGLTISVSCTNGDPMEALERVVAKSAIQVVP